MLMIISQKQHNAMEQHARHDCLRIEDLYDSACRRFLDEIGDGRDIDFQSRGHGGMTTQFQVTFETAVFEALHRIASLHEVPCSAIVGEAVHRFLRARGRPGFVAVSGSRRGHGVHQAWVAVPRTLLPRLQALLQAPRGRAVRTMINTACTAYLQALAKRTEPLPPRQPRPGLNLVRVPIGQSVIIAVLEAAVRHGIKPAAIVSAALTAFLDTLDDRSEEAQPARTRP
jgi:hypothetical protein